MHQLESDENTHCFMENTFPLRSPPGIECLQCQLDIQRLLILSPDDLVEVIAGRVHAREWISVNASDIGVAAFGQVVRSTDAKSPAR